jgi:hypothetical protein
LISGRNGHRLLVGVQMIQRQVAVEIEDSWVVPASVRRDLLQSLALDAGLSEYRAKLTPLAPGPLDRESVTTPQLQ